MAAGSWGATAAAQALCLLAHTSPCRIPQRAVRCALCTLQGAAAEVSAASDEVIENIKVVKLFGAEGRELSRFQALADRAHQLASAVVGLQGESVCVCVCMCVCVCSCSCAFGRCRVQYAECMLS